MHTGPIRPITKPLRRPSGAWPKAARLGGSPGLACMSSFRFAQTSGYPSGRARRELRFNRSKYGWSARRSSYSMNRLGIGRNCGPRFSGEDLPAHKYMTLASTQSAALTAFANSGQPIGIFRGCVAWPSSTRVSSRCRSLGHSCYENQGTSCPSPVSPSFPQFPNFEVF